MAVISEASEFVIGGAWGPKRRCWDIVNKHAYTILLRWYACWGWDGERGAGQGDAEVSPSISWCCQGYRNQNLPLTCGDYDGQMRSCSEALWKL